MTNPTSNFGWQMPTSTDLVTDLPADFEVFGQAVDTTMADLKGGTTGQILSKATNADMDFVWTSANPGDITGITATSPLTGGGTSGDVTVGIQAASTTQSGAVQLTNSVSSTSTTTAAVPANVKTAYDLAAAAIPLSTVTTAGDLVVATGSSAVTRIGIGTSGQVLQSNGTTATWATPSSGASYVAGKNGIINGGFDVWQRSTSATFNNTMSWPAADRWYGISLGAGPTCTMSRQTADTTGLTYGMRFGRNSGQTGIGDIYTGYTFESIDSKRFAGQTVTLSFYVKAGANAPTTLSSQIRTGTGTNQTSATLFSTGWTGGLNNSQSNTVTTTMTRYTQTVTLGSTVNQIMVAFSYTPTGTAGANEWFQIEGVQLELASTASTFNRNSGSYGAELAACQRYYQRSTSSGDMTAPGLSAGSSQAYFTAPLVAQMRSLVGIDYSNAQVYTGNAFGSVSGVTLQSSDTSRLQLNVNGSGFGTWGMSLMFSVTYLAMNGEL